MATPLWFRAFCVARCIEAQDSSSLGIGDTLCDVLEEEDKEMLEEIFLSLPAQQQRNKQQALDSSRILAKLIMEAYISSGEFK